MRDMILVLLIPPVHMQCICNANISPLTWPPTSPGSTASALSGRSAGSGSLRVRARAGVRVRFRGQGLKLGLG